MINLAELYYYENKLTEGLDIKDAIFFGVDLSTIDQNLGKQELLLKIKDQFIDNFATELKATKLHDAYQIWHSLTGVVDTGTEFKPTGSGILREISEDLQEWINKGQNNQDLQNLLNNYHITTTNNPSAFSIYYGLKVLHYISSKFEVEEDNAVVDSFFDDLSQKTITSDDKMVAICSPVFSALFKSCGIQTIEWKDNLHATTKFLEEVVHTQPECKIAITLGVGEDDLSYLKKHFASKIIITSIPESLGVGQKNSFAQLGLKTIGLSESSIKSELEKSKFKKS